VVQTSKLAHQRSQRIELRQSTQDGRHRRTHVEIEPHKLRVGHRRDFREPLVVRGPERRPDNDRRLIVDLWHCRGSGPHRARILLLNLVRGHLVIHLGPHHCARFYDIHVGHSIPGVEKKRLSEPPAATLLRADPGSGGENERYRHGHRAGGVHGERRNQGHLVQRVQNERSRQGELGSEVQMDRLGQGHLVRNVQIERLGQGHLARNVQIERLGQDHLARNVQIERPGQGHLARNVQIERLGQGHLGNAVALNVTAARVPSP